ncbi:MAG: PAS domain S-box protein [Gammaproteobacteria bacterium]|nr:PAS domain S-box protein [Gammaproteobacteria bacterium]
MNWDSPITTTVVDLTVLIALAAIGFAAIRGGAFQFPAHSKKALVLIFIGLVTLAALAAADLVSLYMLSSLSLEADASHSLSHSISNLYWSAAFFAFVFIAAGFLLVTRVIGRYEITLARSDARYRTIVEDQTDLIVRWNRGGIRSWVNDAYCAYLQQPREILVGSSFYPHISEAVIAEYLEKLELLTPEDPAIAGENTFFLLDGSQRWQEWTHHAIFDSDGKWVECQSVGRDITVRKTAEFALIDSENQYRNLIENTTDWVWQANLKGEHTYTNKQLEGVLGYSKEELEALSREELFHPEEIDEVNARLAKSVTEQQGWQHWLVRVRHKDGKYRYLDSNATPRFDSSGTMIGFSGINRDVTFKTLLAESTSNLLAADLRSSQINDALCKFAEYFNVDRFELWWRGESGKTTTRTYAWTRTGVGPTPSTYKLSEIPLVAAQITDNKIIHVADTHALFPDTIRAASIAGSTGSRAFALFPLRVSEGQERIGSGRVAVYESVRNWTEEEINELQLAFNVIAAAEVRMRTRTELQDSERFHALVADVSTDLLKGSIDDSSLTQALQRFALHFNVDSLGCWWFDETRDSVQRSCSWFQEGSNPGPSVFTLNNLPHYGALVLAGEVVRVSDANALHPESSIERALYESMAVTASVFVPLKLGAGLDYVGCGVALKYGETRDWTDMEVEDLQFAFNVIAVAEARMQTESELQGRERFQKFLAEISTQLLETHQNEIGGKIDSALNQIGQHYGLDRTSLWYFEDNKRLVRCVHQWSLEGEEMPIGDAVALDTIPWAGAKVLSGKDILINSIEDVPLEHKEDRAFFEEQGIKSELALPLVIDDQQVGVGAFVTLQQTRSWPEKTKSELRLLVEVLMNAFSRAKANQINQQRERDLARSEALAHVGSYSFFPSSGPNDWPPFGKAYFSEEMQQLFNCTSEDASFDVFISRIHKDDNARVQESMRELLTQGSVLHHEYRLVGRGGEIIHVEDRSEVDRSLDAPGVTKVFGSLKDVSERVVRENELKAALAQIEKLKEDLEEENLELLFFLSYVPTTLK